MGVQLLAQGTHSVQGWGFGPRSDCPERPCLFSAPQGPGSWPPLFPTEVGILSPHPAPDMKRVPGESFKTYGWMEE